MTSLHFIFTVLAALDYVSATRLATQDAGAQYETAPQVQVADNQGSKHVLSDRSGVFAQVQVIGGQGGTPYKIYGGTSGKIVEEIVVWAGEWQIKAIRLTLTGDAPITLGVPAGPTDSFRFQPGETITRLSLWGNGGGSRLGAISFDTNKGNHFNFGMTKWPRKQEYSVDVGSGIFVGMFINAGADIDSAGFVFLNPIASSSLVNVRYPLLSYNSRGISPMQLDHFTTTNQQSSPVRWTFSNSVAVTTSSSWSTKIGVEAFLTVSVTSGVPEIAQVKGQGGWKVSEERTQELTETSTKTLSWNESGELGKGRSISLTAVTTKGQISTPYEAAMRIRMVSGEVFEYPYKGVYQGVSFSDVNIVEA